MVISTVTFCLLQCHCHTIVHSTTNTNAATVLRHGHDSNSATNSVCGIMPQCNLMKPAML